MWFKKASNSPSVMSGEDSLTFLGKGSQCKGVITVEGMVRMDGRLEGEMHAKGTFVVGEQAVIEGDVSADIIIVGGRITGAIVAANKVQLLSTGVVLGTIKTPVLSVEEGACFMGACEAVGWGEVRTLEGAKEALPQPSQAVTRVHGA